MSIWTFNAMKTHQENVDCLRKESKSMMKALSYEMHPEQEIIDEIKKCQKMISDLLEDRSSILSFELEGCVVNNRRANLIERIDYSISQITRTINILALKFIERFDVAHQWALPGDIDMLTAEFHVNWWITCWDDIYLAHEWDIYDWELCKPTEKEHWFSIIDKVHDSEHPFLLQSMLIHVLVQSSSDWDIWYFLNTKWNIEGYQRNEEEAL